MPRTYSAPLGDESYLDSGIANKDQNVEEEIWNPEAHFEVIPGADHFYGAYTPKLEGVLVSFLRDTGV